MNVYGQNEIDFVNEETPVVPASPYAVGKSSSENFCKIFNELGVNTTILRLFNVYGPNQDLNNLKQGMVSIFLSYILKKEKIIVKGSKHRFRDLIAVDDVVDAFLCCLIKKPLVKPIISQPY